VDHKFDDKPALLLSKTVFGNLGEVEIMQSGSRQVTEVSSVNVLKSLDGLTDQDECSLCNEVRHLRDAKEMDGWASDDALADERSWLRTSE
jgi:hypothetical protein